MEPEPAELQTALLRATAAAQLAPVLLAAPARVLGARRVLEALGAFLPHTQPAADSANPCLFIFKTVADSFGKVSYFRVVSGTLRADAHLVNARNGHEERVARPLRPRGKALEPVTELHRGEIGAAAKLLHTATGDTLGPKGCPAAAPIEFPRTSYTMAIRPRNKGDEEKVHAGLTHLLEEDPTLSLEQEPSTRESLLHGLGDVHLEVTLEKLRRKAQVEAVLATPRSRIGSRSMERPDNSIATRSSRGVRGCSGIAPSRSSRCREVVASPLRTRSSGGDPPALPPFGREGCAPGAGAGGPGGVPLSDIKVTLVDGSTHPVDGKDIAFQLAGAMAMREAVERAGPYLLEPVMEVEVTVPQNQMGDVIGHLNARRGHIAGMVLAAEGFENISAQVPLAEMYHFPIELRALTQGRGHYTMRFSHFEEIPTQVAQPIIEAHRSTVHARESATA